MKWTSLHWTCFFKVLASNSQLRTYKVLSLSLPSHLSSLPVVSALTSFHIFLLSRQTFTKKSFSTPTPFSVQEPAISNASLPLSKLLLGYCRVSWWLWLGQWLCFSLGAFVYLCILSIIACVTLGIQTQQRPSLSNESTHFSRIVRHIWMM